MILLTIHVIGITLIVLMVGVMAYRMGYGKGERRALRRMERGG